MKILKEGDGRKGWAVKTVCTGNGNGGGGCGAELLVEEGDLFVTASHARDETTRHLTFSCACCGVRTDVSNAPPHVWDKALGKLNI